MDTSRSFCITTVLECSKNDVKIFLILIFCRHPFMFSTLPIVKAGARDASQFA